MQTQEELRNEQPAWRAGVTPIGAEGLANKGPYFCMSVGTPIFVPYSAWCRVFEERPDGTERLAETLMPGVLYCVHEDAILIDVEIANGRGNNKYKRQAGASEETVTDVPTSPGDNVRYLNQVHGESGLRFIPAFEGRDRRVIRPMLFSTLLRPVVLHPDYLENNPEVAKAVEAQGALAVYEEMFKAGAKRIRTAEFAAQYGEELQRLYIEALPAVAECYRAVRNEATIFLNREDARVRQGAAKGAHYDITADYYMYLLGRTGVDAALTRALEPRELTVKVEREEPIARAQVQCEECGNFANLLATGYPPKFCAICRSPFTDDSLSDVQSEVEIKGQKVRQKA